MPVIIAILVVALTAGSGVAVASQDALPGESLYLVKRTVEAAQAMVANDPEEKAALYLSRVEARIKEVERLQGGPGADRYLPAVIGELAEQSEAVQEIVADLAAHGKETDALVAKLRRNLERQQNVLTKVEQQVPDQAKEAIRHARVVSKRGLERAIERQLQKQQQNQLDSLEAKKQASAEEVSILESGKPASLPGSEAVTHSKSNGKSSFGTGAE